MNSIIAPVVSVLKTIYRYLCREGQGIPQPIEDEITTRVVKS